MTEQNEAIDRDGDNDKDAELRCVGATDTGKQRANNQDHFLVANCTDDGSNVKRGPDPVEASLSGGDEQLLAVADGLGGHSSGEIASQAAVTSLAEVIEEIHEAIDDQAIPSARGSIAERLRQAVVDCNAKVAELALADPSLLGMATTLTTALLRDEKVWIAHAGDSRCYLLEGTKLTRLTEDHNLSSLNHENDNWKYASDVLWNCLGGPEPNRVAVDLTQCQLKPGSSLILCTDGLFRHLSDKQVAEVVCRSESADAACQTLIGLANQRGGTDNITVVIAQHRKQCGETKVDQAEAERPMSGPAAQRDLAEKAGSGSNKTGGEPPPSPRPVIPA